MSGKMFLFPNNFQNYRWDPLGLTGANQNQPILAKLTPAVQSDTIFIKILITNQFTDSVPASIQKQLARITGKDLLGMRTIAEKMTQQPTSRAEFIKELNAKAPNVLFLGTEVYKLGREQYDQARKNLNPDAVKFLRNVIAETAAAVNEAASIFNQQDVGTKKNLQSVFPFIPQLVQSSKNSIQYVSKNF